MRFMLLFKGDVTAITAKTPEAGFIEEMLRFTDELKQAGALIAYEGFLPTTDAARVHTSGNQKNVVNGPFSPEMEQVAGFYLINANSKEEAIEWAKRVPLQRGPVPLGASEATARSAVEVRQVVDTQALPAMTEATRLLDLQIRRGLPVA
jgi:hypothetical protein